MSRSDSDRINDHFAARSRDITPMSVRHAAQLLYVPVSDDPEVTKRCASVLSDTELQRADRFATQSDKALFKQRRVFRRFCGALALGSSQPLWRIDFEKTERGRPYLPNLWFSFSSCRFGFLGAWSSTHAIGVDLEDHSRCLEPVKLAQQFFTASEAKAVAGSSGLASRQTFFRLWSLKEAALKSIGEGLPFGLDKFEFELDPNLCVVSAPPEYGGQVQFNPYIIEGTDNCAALVIRSQALLPP